MEINLYLTSEWWQQPPKCTVFFNSKKIWDGEISKEHVVNIRENETDLPSQNRLLLRMYGKTVDETVVEDNKIVRDQLLCIKKIIINNIDIDHLVFSHGRYWPDYPPHLRQSIPPLPMCLEKIDTLGFNGDWVFDFESPFEIWYLANLP